MTEKDFVIVIGRQFGSGGREIGRRIAEKLGIPYFDKNLLAEAAKAFGFDKDVLADADEKRPSFIRTFLGSSYGNTSDFGCWGSLSPDALYDVQSRVIGRICHAGPCVIVGRTADYIARELTNLFSVFIHSPEAHRARRIVMRNDAADEAEAIRIAKKADSKRESYYNYYTGRRWGAASNYHLSLDASMLSMEETVDLIISFLKARAAKM